MVAQTPQGLVIVYTGDGKGKTTAALGLAMRAAGHGLLVAFLQFIKAEAVGEHTAAGRLAPEMEIFRLGRGFIIGPPAPEHMAAAREAMEFLRQCLVGGRYDMVVADEILDAVALKLIAADEVESLLPDRPPSVHLVLTGRGAWPGLIERADLVTEMRSIKHPFERGTAAQEGIEF
jgi:cob(I)alamin adenosyltransferase